MRGSWRAGFLPAIALVLGSSPAEAVANAKVGKPAPNFTLVTFAKQKVTLADMRGKVFVINRWATWCAPCKAEMPMMSAVHARYKDAGFQIFGVQTQDSLADSKLKNLASVLSYPLVKTFKGSGYPILDGVPTSYVVDRAGIVRYAKAGSFTDKEFLGIVLPLLREPAPAS
jgi:thiol-disulfide isomerase/thioredoxin